MAFLNWRYQAESRIEQVYRQVPGSGRISETSKEVPHDQYELHRFRHLQEDDQLHCWRLGYSLTAALP
jgi:hypothetical protein